MSGCKAPENLSHEAYFDGTSNDGGVRETQQMAFFNSRLNKVDN